MTDHQNLTIVICGIIDKRYDVALYGTVHASPDGFRTLCGQACQDSRETRSTIWWSEGNLRDPNNTTCNRCRRSLGLAKVRDSKILL